MGIMKIIRRADTYIINFSSCAFEFIKMPVKSFKLHKKITFGEIAVNPANTIKFVETCKKIVACFLYCMKMFGSYITCYTYYSEIFWRVCHARLIKRCIKVLNYFRNFPISNPVSLSAFGARGKSIRVKFELMPVFAHPSGLPGRIANYQSIRFYFFCNHSSGTYK